ncbi:MAG TPA: response regulator [Segetibacter sp.]|jgi:CheY-like chemotaxis protein
MKHCEILIIDDDKDDVELLSEAFSKYGVQHIHHVTSVPEAYKYLEEVHPECIPKLIITDLYLPMITGDDFLKQIKSTEKYKDVHVVILSSVRVDSELVRLKEMGASDFLAKPMSYDEYLEMASEIKSKVGL